jgi:hypothetical protein
VVDPGLSSRELSDLAEAIEAIAGRVVARHSRESVKYLAWHYRAHADRRTHFRLLSLGEKGGSSL